MGADSGFHVGRLQAIRDAADGRSFAVIDGVPYEVPSGALRALMRDE